ncbi:MAG: oligosaccharide flippase family protein [Steroidobacteraceae bacterium]
MNLSKKILRNVGAGAVGKAVVAIAGLATFSIMSRHLGPDGMGHYRTILSLLAVASIALDFGLQKVTLKEIAVPGSDVAGIVATAFLLRILFSILAVLLLLAAILKTPIDDGLLTGVAVGGVGWIAYQLSELAVSVFQNQLRQDRAAIPEAFGALATLALVFGVALTGGNVIAMLVAAGLGWFTSATLSWRSVFATTALRWTFNPTIFRTLLRAGLPIAGSGLLMMLHLRGDTLILAATHDWTAAGLYGPAAKFYELALSMVVIFAGLLLPLLVRDGRDKANARIQGAVTLTMLVSSFMVAATLVHADRFVIFLAGDDYRDGGDPLRLLAIAVALAAQGYLLRFAAIARDQQQVMLRVDLQANLISVLIFIILIPQYGLLGAAAGKAMADLITLLLSVFFLRNQVHPGLLRPIPMSATLAIGTWLSLKGLEHMGMHWMPAIVSAAAISFMVLRKTPLLAGAWDALGRTPIGSSAP